MYFFGKSSPTPPTNFTGEKKLAATAAWLAEPPSRRRFSLVGVLMESSAVVPTIRTLMLIFIQLIGVAKIFCSKLRRESDVLPHPDPLPTEREQQLSASNS